MKGKAFTCLIHLSLIMMWCTLCYVNFKYYCLVLCFKYVDIPKRLAHFRDCVSSIELLYFTLGNCWEWANCLAWPLETPQRSKADSSNALCGTKWW